MKKIFTLLLALTFIVNQVTYAGAAVDYYQTVVTRVYDVTSGRVTTAHRVGKAANDLSNAANDSRIVSRSKPATSMALRLRNMATKTNALSALITVAVGAVGWGISEIKEDLYGNDSRTFTKPEYNLSITLSNPDYTGIPSGAISVLTDHYNNDAIPYNVRSVVYLGSSVGSSYGRYEITHFRNNTYEETLLRGGPLTNTVTNTELSDSELLSIVEDQPWYKQVTFDQLFNDPDFVQPLTSPEYTSIIQEAFPSELPANPANPLIEHVPGTAPRITKLTYPNANVDTAPDTLTDPDTLFANSWEPLLPNGQPNPNYDPRSDVNSGQYDINSDPRHNTDLALLENAKRRLSELQKIQKLNKEQLKEQQELQDQLKGLNQESTQKDVLEELKKLNQQNQPVPLEVSGDCLVPPAVDANNPESYVIRQAWELQCNGYQTTQEMIENVANDPFNGKDEITTEINLASKIADITNVNITGSCPADKTVSLLGKTYSISSQPYCDFANAMRPLVMLIGSYLVVLIIVRTF